MWRMDQKERDHRQETSQEFTVGQKWCWQWPGKKEMNPSHEGVERTGHGDWLAVGKWAREKSRMTPRFPV